MDFRTLVALNSFCPRSRSHVLLFMYCDTQRPLLHFLYAGESGLLLIMFNALVASNGFGPLCHVRETRFCTKGAMKKCPHQQPSE
jgi:hypothetical protein